MIRAEVYAVTLALDLLSTWAIKPPFLSSSAAALLSSNLAIMSSRLASPCSRRKLLKRSLSDFCTPSMSFFIEGNFSIWSILAFAMMTRKVIVHGSIWGICLSEMLLLASTLE